MRSVQVCARCSCNDENKWNKSMEHKSQMYFYFAFHSRSVVPAPYKCSVATVVLLVWSVVPLPHFISFVSIAFPLLHAYFRIVHIINIHLYYIFMINLFYALMKWRDENIMERPFGFLFFSFPRQMEERKKNERIKRILK